MLGPEEMSEIFLMGKESVKSSKGKNRPKGKFSVKRIIKKLTKSPELEKRNRR